MRYRLSCRSCGGAIIITHADAGQRVACLACGARVDVPPGLGAPGEVVPIDDADHAGESAVPPSPQLQLPSMALDQELVDPTFRLSGRPDAFAAERAEHAAERATQAAGPGWREVLADRRRRQRRRLAAVLAAGGVVTVSAAVALWPRTSPEAAGPQAASATADEQVYAELQRVREAAARHAAEGRWEAAATEFRALSLLADSPQVKTVRETSPRVADLLRSAAAEHDRVARRLASPQPPTAPLPTTRSGVPAGVSAGSTRPTSVPLVVSAALSPGGIDFAGRRTGVPPPPVVAATRPATAPAEPPPGPRDGIGPTGVALVGGARLRPVDAQLAADNPAVLDAAVEAAIRDGAAYLLRQFDANGELPRQRSDQEMHRYGLHALCVYALLSAAQATDEPTLRPNDPAIARLIDRLKSYPMDTLPQAPPRPVTYARSLRASALTVFNRDEDRERLRSDIAWLVDAHYNGSYSYDDRFAKWTPPFDALDNPRTPGFAPPSGLGMRPVRPNTPQGMGLGQNASATPPPSTAAPQPFQLNLSRSPGQPAPPTVPARPTHPSSGRIVGGSGMIGGGAMGGAFVAPPGMGLGAFRRRPGGYGQRNAQNPNAGSAAPFNTPPWDHSNDQLAVWAVHLGSSVGVNVPPTYWDLVLKHWTRTHLPSGGWGYDERDTTASLAMTAGGLASVLAAAERAGQASLTARFMPAKPPPAADAALTWLSHHDTAVTIPGSRTRYVGYDLFALARAGAMGGHKYLGSHDWYRDLAERAVVAQREDGSWGVGAAPPGNPAAGNAAPADPDSVVDTAFHLLFLSAGRHPVMFNKLRHGGDWNARPRDAANATLDTARQLGRPLIWQVVGADQPASDWLDSPVLYFSTGQAVRQTDADIARLREYVVAGGLLVLHCDNGAGVANKWADELCGRLFPQYPLQPVPAEHPLYTTPNRVRPDDRRLRAVGNGSRVLVLVAADDLGSAWQERDEADKPAPFRLAMNLFNYAHGREQPRPRLSAADLPAPAAVPLTILPVARVQWDGNWNPEPAAWTRFGRVMQWETGAGVMPRTTVPADLRLADAKLAHLTGTGVFSLTAADAAGIRQFVESGGVLLVDACGGDAAFARSAEQALLAACPGLTLKPAAPTDPPLAKRYDVMDDLTAPPALRPYARANGVAQPLRVARFGHGVVVFSSLDLTSGLVGVQTWGINGYTPDYAAGLVKNVVVWSTAGR